MNVARVDGEWILGLDLLQWCHEHISPPVVHNPDGWVGEGWILEWYEPGYWQIEMDDLKQLTVFLLTWT